LPMAIKRLLMTFAFIIVSIVFSSGVSFALTTTDGASGSTFVWSQVSPTAGTKSKVLEIVSSPLKGTPTYRATGACALRKGVLSFNRVGKCRVSVSVKMKSTGKVLRSSKVFMVQAKTPTVVPSISGMPNPIGCVPVAKHPLSGTPYPDSMPGIYDFQTAWTCDWGTIDARPLLEYFKSQGWTTTTATDGVIKTSMQNGSKRMNYLNDSSGMPEGLTLLILTIK
jgi:hypothetical protein